jgi:4-hydroxy-3-polyprenylbenzoate decarboxylase
MGTLSAIAAGSSRSLVERAADVALKERRPLILVPRETPLSAVHLENMLRVTRAGAVVLPAAPGFYHRPARIDDLVDFIVARILDHLGVEHAVAPRWGEPGAPVQGPLSDVRDQGQLPPTSHRGGPRTG